MFFWWWLSSDRSVDMHKVLLVAAFVVALAGGALLTLASTRGDWREATAQVLSIETVCAFRSSGGFRQRSTEVVVPCGQTQQFRQDNPGRSWSFRQYHQGRLQITGEGTSVVVEAGLLRYFGGNPRVGDRAKVLQDPRAPGSIASLDSPLQLSVPGYGLLALGGFFAFIAFMWF